MVASTTKIHSHKFVYIPIVVWVFVAKMFDFKRRHGACNVIFDKTLNQNKVL